MPAPKNTPPRGILNRGENNEKFTLLRFSPSESLADHVEHFWVVTWELKPGKSFKTEILPHPSFHIAIEARRAELVGVVTGKFSRLLRGKGRVFGIKFRPAAFFDFYRVPASRLTDKKIALARAFGEPGDALKCSVLAEAAPLECCAMAEEFLLKRLARRHREVPFVRNLVEAAAKNQEITRVEDLARLAKTDVRRLQRLFSRYVGVSPKWVIQRYRLHEAAEQLQKGATSITEIAQNLGYFDQAHFTRDFKAIVGCAPGRFTRTKNS